MLKKIARTRGSGWIILVRLLVGGVFLVEGLQKFVLPAQFGAGRFARIGIPLPELTAPLVGGVEILCSSMLLLGLLTRLAAAPLLVVIAVAIAMTDAPVFRDGGFWAGARAARTDWCMLWGCLFLLVVGGGRASVDAGIAGGGAGMG